MTEQDVGRVPMIGAGLLFDERLTVLGRDLDGPPAEVRAVEFGKQALKRFVPSAAADDAMRANGETP